jgi:hypothetical protein
MNRNHEYLVIHPLDDAPETKLDASQLGPIKMPPGVYVSLMLLRGYLVLMMVLLGYRLLGLAGLLGS